MLYFCVVIHFLYFIALPTLTQLGDLLMGAVCVYRSSIIYIYFAQPHGQLSLVGPIFECGWR